MTETVFKDWKPQHSEVWGKHLVAQDHRLHERDLFTDEAIADLIENYPRNDYSLVMPGRQDQPQHALWREGDMGKATGAETLQAINDGFLWINLRNLPKVDRRFKELAEEIYDEMQANVPGLKVKHSELTLLITSPRAQTYYHCDVPGQSLWQIRGVKKVFLYPAVTPFMPEELLERVILQDTEEDIEFKPLFEVYAESLDLHPGTMLHWPQYAPHRVENKDMLNISITTEHWTSELERSYKVRYANGLLRHRFGLNPQSTDTAGPGYLAKAILQSVWRRSGLAKRSVWSRKIDFRLDPGLPGKVSDITPFTLNPY
jgi:hypothetical protein